MVVRLFCCCFWFEDERRICFARSSHVRTTRSCSISPWKRLKFSALILSVIVFYSSVYVWCLQALICTPKTRTTAQYWNYSVMIHHPSQPPSETLYLVSSTETFHSKHPNFSSNVTYFCSSNGASWFVSNESPSCLLFLRQCRHCTGERSQPTLLQTNQTGRVSAPARQSKVCDDECSP